MSEEVRYLYSTPVYNDYAYRYRIIRETKTNIWIEYKPGREIKISKKTLKTGHGVDCTYWYHENKTWKKKYENTVLRFKFKDKLELLSKCTDINIMKKVLEIELPKEGDK